jgi:hypothetical protein
MRATGLRSVQDTALTRTNRNLCSVDLWCDIIIVICLSEDSSLRSVFRRKSVQYPRIKRYTAA